MINKADPKMAKVWSQALYADMERRHRAEVVRIQIESALARQKAEGYRRSTLTEGQRVAEDIAAMLEGPAPKTADPFAQVEAIKFAAFRAFEVSRNDDVVRVSGI